MIKKLAIPPIKSGPNLFGYLDMGISLRTSSYSIVFSVGEDDKEFQFACRMCIIQIGELVAGLDESFAGKYLDVPWRQIKGMRNIYAHDYDIIDNDIIWEAITKEIPELKEKLQIIFSAL